MAKGARAPGGSSSSAKEIQRAAPGNIRTLLLDGSQPTLLLGAGASVTSGIPAAEETAEKAARWAWCQAHGRSPDDVVLRSDYWPWLCAQPWFSEARSFAEQYPLVIAKLLGVRKTRRDFFERLIAPAVRPNVGYRSLARILNEGWISTVLTTNFDHCLDDARVLENKPHLLVSIKTPDDLVRFSSSPADPQLIYLHGSVEHYSDKNLDEEIDALDPVLVQRLAPLLSDHPIVVVGYRGAEPSIMRDLFLSHVEVTNNFAQGVYWCVREADTAKPMSPLLEEFAHTIGRNFQLVAVKGFDELFEKDLWNNLAASGALPIRKARGFGPIEVPADMRPMAGCTPSDLDSHTLTSRLSQYAKRLGLRVPDVPDGKWLNWEIRARNLVADVNDVLAPTLAGWLLFARDPSSRTPHAIVRFRAIGPVHWIKGCFGEDAVAGAPDKDGNASVEQEIAGTLWAQLDALTDLLSLVNQGFRLKEEESRTAYPFQPIALKEVLVNALVHRDYERSEPITVTVEPGKLEVISPGGLVAEVTAQTSGQNLEEVITAGGRGIKGYRNPVISDLFYGGGQMDRAGSGLADIWLMTINNNGQVHFGPENSNSSFKVVIFARPEAVDEITNTATPVSAETVRYAANLLPIDAMPERIWHAGTSAKTVRALMKEAQGLAVPSGYIQDGRYFSLYDLESLVEVNVTPFEVGDVESMTLKEVLMLPNGENVVLKLMHDAVAEHLRSLGLFVEYGRRRAYFRRSIDGERKVTYKGRVKRATRTVVKERTRRDSNEVIYYEHKAVGYSVVRFGDDWALALTPGYAFTRDGESKPIGRDRINVLSTRRAARDFNPSVHHDVTFWAATLSQESDGLFALRQTDGNQLSQFAPDIFLSSRLPTISFNTSSFGRTPEDEVDTDLSELEDELAALAEEPEEEKEERDDDD